LHIMFRITLSVLIMHNYYHSKNAIIHYLYE
jgi:hypothetical protein